MIHLKERRYEKMVERVGRAMESYPSIAQHYQLNLRPIYHQKDERSDTHLFFGLLAYWVVNTIRLELKRADENYY